jgi:ubiquinone/menaquinone biosynthesis C-methylase UbiE
VARQIVAVCLLSTIALPAVAQRSTPAQLPPVTQPSPLRAPDVVFLPSDDAVVDAMLKLANVHKNDVVYDLGCGDGKIVIAAAKKYGVRAVGIDIDPERIREANANAAAAGVTDHVRFILGDIFDEAVPIRDATVVTLFLLQRLNKQLRPRLLRELAPGTRVVSNSFNMGDDWPPQRTELVNNFTIYLWTIPRRAPAR